MVFKVDTVDYSFRLVGIDEFLLKFRVVVPDKIFETIYNSSISKLNKKGVDPPSYSSTLGVSNFFVPADFFGIIKTATRRQVKNIFSLVKKDRIVVLRYYVSSCFFERVGGDWFCDVVFGGYCVDNRFGGGR